MLFVSFFRKSLSRVLWTSLKGIGRDAMRFQELGRHFGLLPCGTNSLDLMWKCFLGRLELRTPLFFLHNQYNKKTFIRDRTHFSNL